MTDSVLWRSEGEQRLSLEMRTLSGDGGAEWRQPVLVQGNGVAGAVMCATTDDEVLLVSAWRPLLGRRVLELPRGWTDRVDEDGSEEAWAVRTAVRECREETGAEVADASFVGWLSADSGLMASRIGVVAARIQTLADDHRTAEGVARLLSRGDLSAAIDSGELCDGITLGALAMSHVL